MVHPPIVSRTTHSTIDRSFFKSDLSPVQIMGGALSSLIDKATMPVDKKIEELRQQLDAQNKLLKEMEVGYDDKYQVFIDNLEKQGIKVEWPQHNTESQCKVMEDHVALSKLAEGLLDTVGDVTTTVVGFAEGDKDNSAKAHSAWNDVKNDLSSAFNIFLAAEVGVTKKVSKNVYILREMSIRVVYLQSYNITLQAGALDGTKSISCYIYSFNSADIDIFKSDRRSIITKLGATKENILAFKELIKAMQDLEDSSQPVRSDATLMSFKSARVESEKAAQLRAIAQELAEMTPETLHLLN